MIKKIIRSYYYLVSKEEGCYIYTKDGHFLKTEDIERAEIWSYDTAQAAAAKCKEYGIDCKVVLINVIFSQQI